MGLADYADSFVAAAANIRARVGPNVDVVPLVNIPIQGVDSPVLIRDMIELDCWLLAAQQQAGTILQNTRKTFWEQVSRELSGEVVDDQSTHTLVLPNNLRSGRKRAYTLEPFDRSIPASILPVPEGIEEKIVCALVGELNEVYGLGLNATPDINRNTAPTVDHSRGRIVLMGASHMNRVAMALTSMGADVLNLCTPGWCPTSEKLSKAKDDITAAKVGHGDITVFDLLSNSCFFGTDEYGLPEKAYKSNVDGKHHILGELQHAPKQVFQKIMTEAEAAIAAATAGGGKVFLIVPFPRYLAGTCCRDSSHLTNFGKDGYSEIFSKTKEMVTAAAGVAIHGQHIHTIELNECVNDTVLCEGILSNCGNWDKDNVHLLPHIYRAVAEHIVHLSDVESEQPAKKRQRLDSIVPPTVHRGRFRSVTLPAWISGGPTPQNRGRGGGRGGGWGPGGSRGGRPFRGGSADGQRGLQLSSRRRFGQGYRGRY
jgi:hypothetical protein